jgi:hypothetical protein
LINQPDITEMIPSAFLNLVGDGGRPLHSLEQMEDTIRDPGEFHELLSFWQGKEEEWVMFSRQFEGCKL